jgi:hypothetical protein
MVKNNIEYASIYTPKRVDGKKVNDPVYLGRVIDKEAGIYQNKKQGQFKFSLDTGISQLDNYINININTEEKSILGFGDIYLCDSVLSNLGFKSLFQGIYDKSPDSLMALILFKMLTKDAHCHALDWWSGTYAKLLYPNAVITSQRISEHLELLGNESIQTNFFHKYYNKIYGINKNCGILLDSTGLPNNINFELTAINNHNGIISRETRLIYIIDRETQMPIYFRYNAGNIVDVSTLKNTLEELKKYGIHINYSILDAGYYSDINLIELFENKIPFITRMVPNRKIYKDFQSNDIDDLISPQYAVLYQNRLLYIKRKPFIYYGHKAFAYLIIDSDRHNKEYKDFLKNETNKDNASDKEKDSAYKTSGFFIIISSECIEAREILPLYYTRQAIEEIFDVCKNNTDILPIGCHSLETFRGYIFVHFLSTIAYLNIRKLFSKSKYNILDGFSALRYLYCKVYDDFILIKEPTKKMKDILNFLNITIPLKIFLNK